MPADPTTEYIGDGGRMLAINNTYLIRVIKVL